MSGPPTGFETGEASDHEHRERDGDSPGTGGGVTQQRLDGQDRVRDRQLARYRPRNCDGPRRGRRRRRDQQQYRRRRGGGGLSGGPRAGSPGQDYVHNVALEAEVDALCNQVKADFGHIDILVNNAGITRDRSFKKLTKDVWDEVINTNLTSVFLVTKHFVDAMAERGWGRVINISSIVGEIGNFGQANYAAAKAGMIGLTKTLAREYARKGVTVNAVAPGFIKTRMTSDIPEKAMDAVLAITPVGRMGDPLEIAAGVAFLASPSAGFITGAVLDINGGLSM